MSDDKLYIDNTEIKNRLIIGTGKFKNKEELTDCIIESGTNIATVALRRIDKERHEENILEYLPKDIICMTNTSGARNAKEAIRLAHISRDAGLGHWVKIEVIDDSKYLLPDNYETIKATAHLVKEGFVVFPYMYPDLYVARELENVGAHSVMPLGGLIGSKSGIKADEFIKILISEIQVPIIVDAGIGHPSHAAYAMEIGADAVLVNTAIATAPNPPQMARAFRLATQAGRIAYNQGKDMLSLKASASSPLTGFLFENSHDN